MPAMFLTMCYVSCASVSLQHWSNLGSILFSSQLTAGEFEARYLLLWILVPPLWKSALYGCASEQNTKCVQGLEHGRLSTTIRVVKALSSLLVPSTLAWGSNLWGERVSHETFAQRSLVRLMAHACNLSYSGGRDPWFKASPGKIVCKTVSQNTQHKKGLAEWPKW
jgi:hypothetical protein